MPTTSQPASENSRSLRSILTRETQTRRYRMTLATCCYAWAPAASKFMSALAHTFKHSKSTFNEIQLSRNAYENWCFIAVRYVHVRAATLCVSIYLYLYLYLCIAGIAARIRISLRTIIVIIVICFMMVLVPRLATPAHTQPETVSAFGRNVSRYIIATFSRR